MKLKRKSDIDNLSDLEQQDGTGVVFCPYVPHIFNLNDLYPHVIKPFNLNTKKDEIKTKIRYRQFKRFRATGC